MNLPTGLPAGIAVALALAAPALASAPPTATQSNGSRAVYTVEFDVTWSQQTHPGSYPFGAHVSTPIGATHREGFHLWQAGGLATTGIERMAELGNNGVLGQEISVAIAAGDAYERHIMSAFSAPGTRSLDLVVTDEFPAVTLVTMVAPSPDWFVGADGALLLQNGTWVDELVVPLTVWDAGTDSGVSFMSGDIDTVPQEPIALQTGGPFEPTNPIGTLTFTRRRSTLVYGSGVNPTGSLTVGGDPRPGETITLRLDDPLAALPASADAFVLVSLAPSPSFPAGRVLPGYGLAAPGADGELLVAPPFRRVAAGTYVGAPLDWDLALPTGPGFVGATIHAQGLLLVPGGPAGLTDAVEIVVGN